MFLFCSQIDGSTLKTLCIQHGPLQNFHLYLNQGLALARYSTREEAAKVRNAIVVRNKSLSETYVIEYQLDTIQECGGTGQRFSSI